MPQVYLPFGYPRLSGMEFQNVIYQGEMVRLYVVPVDPRNDAQIEQRELFADLARVRGSLGSFGRAVARQILGSRWTGVFTQIIKADVGGWWSGALALFDGFTSLGKDAWRSACPNQATYNDVGRIYFAVARTLAHALLEYGQDLWGVDLWGEGDSAAATAWWTRLIDTYKSAVYGRDMERSAGWSVAGIAISSGGVNDWARTYWAKRRVWVQFRNPSGNPVVSIRVDGAQFTNYTVTSSIDYLIEFPSTRLRQIEIYKLDFGYLQLWGLQKPV